MAGFWSGLGQGLANYGMGMVRRSPAGMFMHPRGQGLNLPLDRQIATQDASGANIPSAAQGSDLGAFNPTPYDESQSADQNWSGASGGMDAFAGGKIVTKPTTALVGDQGPEAIIPLNPKPGQKTSPGMLGGSRARFRHVTGPGALRTLAPVRADLPLRPNVVPR